MDDDALKGQKHLYIKAFALSGRIVFQHKKPKALPWAMCYRAFSPSKKLFAIGLSVHPTKNYVL